MLKSAASKVMWVGRATVFLIGLATILLILFWVASVALWAGGAPSLLDELGQENGISRPFASDAGKDRSLAVETVARRRAPQGYARVTTSPPFFDSSRSKGVIGIQRVTPAGSSAASVYCFDLGFTPKVAIASPFFANNAVVGTVTPPNDLLNSACPATHRDMAAQTFAANTSEKREDINFSIMFR